MCLTKLLTFPLLHRPIRGLDFSDPAGKKPIDLECDPTKPVVAYAFKLDEKPFGQLTYMRVYQGTLKRGEWIENTQSQKRLKVPRLVRMNSNEFEDIEQADAGDICAMFGVDCYSGTTFTDGAKIEMVCLLLNRPSTCVLAHTEYPICRLKSTFQIQSFLSPLLARIKNKISNS